jgi:hypothetical protein
MSQANLPPSPRLLDFSLFSDHASAGFADYGDRRTMPPSRGGYTFIFPHALYAHIWYIVLGRPPRHYLHLVALPEAPGYSPVYELDSGTLRAKTFHFSLGKQVESCLGDYFYSGMINNMGERYVSAGKVNASTVLKVCSSCSRKKAQARIVKARRTGDRARCL